MTMSDTRTPSVSDPRVVAAAETAVPYIQWGPIIGGAFAAAALAFVLHAFAAAIGMAVSSTAPTWRDASIALWILSGLYLILAALASYGLGGYIAGRTRTKVSLGPDEIEMRDGGHGLLVWALATLLAGVLALATAQTITRIAAPSGGAAGPAASAAGENLIAFDLDKLFRADPPTEGELDYGRAEAARILLMAGGHTGLAADDRAYLVRMVAARTGTAQPEAERRVDMAIASARNNISRARRSAVILAFMAGAAAMLGAAAAWFAACVGGRHRNGLSAAPGLLLWGWGGPLRNPPVRIGTP
jgi:hypothetical protein